MATVIGVAGSPRRNGNSTTLMRAALNAASDSGAQTREMHLNDLALKGCQGCGTCSPGGRCVLQDELTPVLDDLRNADCWVLASPIYFDGVSGQMKTFFDRCHTFCIDPDTQEVKAQLTGKKRAAVIVTYEDKPRDDYRQQAGILASYLGWMGDFGEVEIMSEGKLGPADAARNRGDLVRAAGELGKRLGG